MPWIEIMDFPTAFDILIDPAHEGIRYANDSSDPGGETKFGISKRSYPLEDISNLTKERARELYLRDFWGPSGCDSLPDTLRFLHFDCAVNSGPDRAIRILQSAVAEVSDGILGPLTLQAVQSADWRIIAMRLIGLRQKFQIALPNWKSASAGWANRNAENLLIASGAPPQPPNRTLSNLPSSARWPFASAKREGETF